MNLLLEANNQSGKPLDQQFLEATGNMFFRISRDGTYLDFRPSGDLAPYVEPDIFLGRRMSEILPEDVAIQSCRAINEALTSGRPQRIEYELRERDGARYKYEARILPNGSDDVVAAVRRVAPVRESAQESDDILFQAILENVSEPAWIWSRGLLVYVNPAFAMWSGCAAGDLIGQPMLERVAERSRTALNQYLRQDEGRAGSSVYRLWCRSWRGEVEVELRVSIYLRGSEIFHTAIVKDLAMRVHDMPHRVERTVTNRHDGHLSRARTLLDNKASKPLKLSPRELQVLRLVADGKSTKEIAGLLGISVKTADSHRTHLMAKAGVHDTVTLLRYCSRLGLVHL
jgi:PAS domain S-box-containing protein